LNPCNLFPQSNICDGKHILPAADPKAQIASHAEQGKSPTPAIQIRANVFPLKKVQNLAPFSVI
jgi:hypothetical protein